MSKIIKEYCKAVIVGFENPKFVQRKTYDPSGKKVLAICDAYFTPEVSITEEDIQQRLSDWVCPM
tara:strand:- start:308 stop:502 length:195 start_codon:yes stop_codon:yes gene_type:complete